jgi:hypothetical protein
MKTAHLVFIGLVAAMPASAQTWQEYRDAELGFAASFPGTPTVTDTTYRTADGVTYKAKLYSLRQGSSEYRMLVADYATAPLQDDAAIADAAKTLSATGKVTVDIAARVNRNYGRQLGITMPDGSQSVSAIFFANHRLYEIEGITHPGENANSSNAARFQQSLNFLGGYGFGFGGRRGRPDFGRPGQ